MNLLLLILIILLLGGGLGSHLNGWGDGAYGFGGLGTVLLIVFVVLLFR